MDLPDNGVWRYGPSSGVTAFLLWEPIPDLQEGLPGNPGGLDADVSVFDAGGPPDVVPVNLDGAALDPLEVVFPELWVCRQQNGLAPGHIDGQVQ